MQYLYQTMPSPVGLLKLVASTQGLAGILWEDDKPERTPHLQGAQAGTNAVLAATQLQLQEYFDGTRTTFDLPLDFTGTDFNKRLWAKLLTIPYGETRTYGELANELGSPGAARAVGLANSRNPISIIAPCHRVIGANGKLTGFAGGLKAKAFLLGLESRDLFNATR